MSYLLSGCCYDVINGFLDILQFLSPHSLVVASFLATIASCAACFASTDLGCFLSAVSTYVVREVAIWFRRCIIIDMLSVVMDIFFLQRID